MSRESMAALAKANEVRYARGRAKHALRAGTLTIAEMLLLPECQGMTVESVLCAQHYWGPHRAARALSAAGIGPARTVGELTVRQRLALTNPANPPQVVAVPDATRCESANVLNACPECGLPKHERGPGVCGFCVEEAA